MSDRMYRFPDAELILHAQVIETLLPDDIADFFAFDSTITADYPATIDQALTNVAALQSDWQVLGLLEEEIQRVNKCMADCYATLKTIVFFAKKAFPGQDALLILFGVNQLAKIRRNQWKMILFLETLEEPLTVYQDQLLAVGCSPSVFADFFRIADELKMANRAQRKMKEERLVITQERVEKLNDLYLIMKSIHDIAQTIYQDDPARREKYSLPQSKS